MSLAHGLLKGRSHIIFMAGLLVAGGTILSLERSSLLQPPVRIVPGTATTEAATIAWRAAARAPDPAEAAGLARRLGIDTAAPLAGGPAAMSPAAGRAVLAALIATPQPAATR